MIQGCIEPECNVFLISNTGGLLSGENACFLPEPTQTISIQNFPWKKDFHNSHTGLRTIPLCSLCVCWVLPWFGASFFLLGKMGSTWFPRFSELTRKTSQPGSRIWETHWTIMHLAAGWDTCQGKLLGSLSSAVDLPGWVLLGEQFRNKPCSEGWGLCFCLADCVLTPFLSPCHPVRWLMQMNSSWT